MAILQRTRELANGLFRHSSLKQRNALLNEEEYERKAIRLKSNPTTYILGLTNVCNFDCTFCPKQEMTRHYEYMDFERVCGIIDEIAEYNMAEKITFHVMGEPFMHPRFFEILEHAAQLGVKTGITTNGTYLDEEMAIKLEKVTASQVNISLQTPDEESFKTRKSRRMKFDEYHNRILKFIEGCLKQEKPPKIKVHFLNTSIKTEVPGEDWTVGSMSVINNTKDLPVFVSLPTFIVH